MFYVPSVLYSARDSSIDHTSREKSHVQAQRFLSVIKLCDFLIRVYYFGHITSQKPLFMVQANLFQPFYALLFCYRACGYNKLGSFLFLARFGL